MSPRPLGRASRLRSGGEISLSGMSLPKRKRFGQEWSCDCHDRPVHLPACILYIMTPICWRGLEHGVAS